MATTPAVASEPEEYALDARSTLIQTEPDDGGRPWTPMWHRACGFGPDQFDAVMQNLVRNPNLLSSWLFRADIVAETTQAAQGAASLESAPPFLPQFAGFERADEQTIVRRLVPRNTMRDKPMLQTCLFYEGSQDGTGADGIIDVRAPVHRSLVVYIPHVRALDDVPFYHPKVQGVGFLHEWQAVGDAGLDTAAGTSTGTGTGIMSIHFWLFPDSQEQPGSSEPGDPKRSRPILSRVALNLVNTVCKHGEGKQRGYVKRVHHDQLVTQARVQDRYTRLKEKHARRLVDAWQETTDPAKHVFEDLAIAAFLMELWADMYGAADGRSEDGVPAAFPGFVDVGCGNGLLVHVLNAEGYRGWGFDARRRRSWRQYGCVEEDAGNAGDEEAALRERLLLPPFLLGEDGAESMTGIPALHDGVFPPGTFLIANHADELTVWTPLLAALSGCPFLAIPCCSHNFTGAKFRAPPPSAAAKAASASVALALASASTYASFVEWVAGVARDCGWEVEREMLRMPSTRNVGLVGRRRCSTTGGGATTSTQPFTVGQAWAVIAKYGGAHGFADNVAKLAVPGKKCGH